jgi:hypothetical protein
MADNLLSVSQYPLVVLQGYENAVAQTAGEEFRVADGRRSPGGWSGVTTNVEYILKWTNDRTRSLDYVLVDRGYTLTRLICELSDDDFASPAQLVFDITLPTVTATGAVDDALGVRTEDGMWLKGFPVRGSKYGRLRMPAMGAGLRPRFRAYPGLSYKRTRYDVPFSDDTDVLKVQEVVTPAGVRGRGTRSNPRRGVIHFQMHEESFEYPLFRDHVLTKFGRGAPMCIVHDDQQADRAVLAIREGEAELGTQVTADRLTQRVGIVPWVEHDPMRNR